MAVAKSYENMQIIGEPYTRDGRAYVKVIGNCKRCGGSGHYSFNPLDGTTCFACRGSGKEKLEVRWYTDAQRATMDKAAEKRKAAAAVKQEERRIKFAARNAFGFGEAGYITLIWGNNDEIKEWREDLPEHTVWFNDLFNWFIPAGREPENIPESIHSFKLNWDEVKNPDDEENLEIKDRAEVRKYIESIIFIPSKSEYQGTPNEWLQREVIIKKNILVTNNFGDSHLHIMEDENENIYVWTTSSKSLEEGKTYTIKMKVKEHKEYQGTKQTVVYYCKIIKE